MLQWQSWMVARETSLPGPKKPHRSSHTLSYFLPGSPVALAPDCCFSSVPSLFQKPTMIKPALSTPCPAPSFTLVTSWRERQKAGSGLGEVHNYKKRRKTELSDTELQNLTATNRPISKRDKRQTFNGVWSCKNIWEKLSNEKSLQNLTMSSSLVTLGAVVVSWVTWEETKFLAVKTIRIWISRMDFELLAEEVSTSCLPNFSWAILWFCFLI